MRLLFALLLFIVVASQVAHADDFEPERGHPDFTEDEGHDHTNGTLHEGAEETADEHVRHHVLPELRRVNQAETLRRHGKFLREQAHRSVRNQPRDAWHKQETPEERAAQVAAAAVASRIAAAVADETLLRQWWQRVFALSLCIVCFAIFIVTPVRCWPRGRCQQRCGDAHELVCCRWQRSRRNPTWRGRHGYRRVDRSDDDDDDNALDAAERGGGGAAADAGGVDASSGDDEKTRRELQTRRREPRVVKTINVKKAINVKKQKGKVIIKQATGRSNMSKKQKRAFDKYTARVAAKTAAKSARRADDNYPSESE
jgi:hypothetical protein